MGFPTNDTQGDLPPEATNIVLQYCTFRSGCCIPVNRWLAIKNCRLVSKRWKSFFESVPFFWDSICFSANNVKSIDFVLPIVNSLGMSWQLTAIPCDEVIDKLMHVSPSLFSNLTGLTIDTYESIYGARDNLKSQKATVDFILYLDRASGGLSSVSLMLESSWSSRSLARLLQKCKRLNSFSSSRVTPTVFKKNWPPLPQTLRELYLCQIQKNPNDKYYDYDTDDSSFAGYPRDEDGDSPKSLAEDEDSLSDEDNFTIAVPRVSRQSWKFPSHMEKIELECNIRPTTISIPSSVTYLALDIPPFALAPDSGPFHNLKHLSLPYTIDSGELFESFVEKGATNLEHLVIGLPRETILFVCRNNHNLKSLHFQSRTPSDTGKQLTLEDYRQIVLSCPELELVTLDYDVESREIYQPLFELQNLRAFFSRFEYFNL